MSDWAFLLATELFEELDVRDCNHDSPIEFLADYLRRAYDLGISEYKSSPEMEAIEEQLWRLETLEK